MSDYSQHERDRDRECSDDDGGRADQPPSGQTDCPAMPTTEPPTPYEPPECPKPPACNCPEPPGATVHCLETLIEKETKQLTIAEKAKASKAELEGLLTKAKDASTYYTAKEYANLLKQWGDQDTDIAELIRKLVCAVPCWRCIIECYVCPLLNDLRAAEQQLIGDGKLPAEMHSIYDLRYWHERDREAKDRIFQRVKLVLAAWEKPQQTIAKILGDNAKLIVECNKAIGTDPSNAVYDVFLKLVPLHLAIAPPASEKKTKIAKKFTDFCACDTGKPDNCCGPDVGELTLRQRLIGTQPYLIKPDYYFKLICCLVEKRYQPAKNALADATAAFEEVDNDIKRYKEQLKTGLDPQTFEKNAKGRIPSPIECCGDKLPKPEEPNQSAKTGE